MGLGAPEIPGYGLARQGGFCETVGRDKPVGMTDTQIAATFHPHHALAQVLLARLDPAGTDGSHDLSHIIRVWRNAAAIAAIERGCDLELLVAAVILHDCVAVAASIPGITAGGGAGKRDHG